VDLDRILVATDLGPDGDEAIRQANAWANLHGATLMACTVLPTPFVRPTSPINGDPFWPAQEMLRARLANIAGRPADEAIIAIRHGAPFVEIGKLAEELEADLIVLGSRQRNGLRRSLRGGTAEQVVRAAFRPVLIAKPSPSSASVLAATDLSDPCFPVIAAGADYAERRAGTLSVLHCIEPESIPPPYSMIPSAFSPSRKDRTEMRAALLEVLASLEVEGEGLVYDSMPRIAILREAEARGCEMVVVGTAGRRGLMRLALGNLAETILRRAPCSTLVVRLGARLV
jgi:nucleotide-binding universal stress UspA family protein